MPIAVFGSIFALGACIMLILASVSTPVVKSINFLNVDLGSTTLHFGAWGYCATVSGVRTCSKEHLGYNLGDRLDQYTGTDDNVRGWFEHGLTYALVMNPIAAGIAFLAVLFSICGSVVSHIIGSIVAFFAFIVAVVALGLDLGLFVAARHRFNSNLSGSPASLGNAMWFVTAAVVALFVASLTICCGGIRDNKTRRRSAYASDPAYTGVATGPAMAQPSRFNIFARHRGDAV